MQRPILVPVDGSPFSERAIPVAIGIANRNELRVELVLVHEPLLVTSPGPRLAPYVSPILDGEWRSRQGAYIRDTVARFSTVAQVPITGSVMDGPVAAGIAEHANRTNAQLVVMATHGETAHDRLWLASIPRAMTHMAPVPVLLVKTGISDEKLPRDRFHVILIPVDGSALSETAIQHAVKVGGKTGVEYTLLRVVTPVEEWELGAGSWAADDALALSEANAYLEKLAVELHAQGYRVTARTIRARRSAQAILAYAKENGVDLIAITTHSRSAAGRFFRRSVADRIARCGDIAALVAREYRQASITTEAQPSRESREPVLV